MWTAFFAVKFAFFLGLVRSAVRFEPLGERPVTLAALYTAGVAFLSWYLVVDRLAWGRWLAITFVLATIYFWLLNRFEDAGLLWWLILIAGVGLVLY